jgi:hypothetical protein
MVFGAGPVNGVNWLAQVKQTKLASDAPLA